MDERRLQVFCAVARELNFTRAALELHMSQSAVSQQVAALERELGDRLFERARRRVRLTPAGVALERRAEAILADIAEARRAVAAVRGAIEGDLRVAASQTVGAYLLPGPVATLGRRHPALRLQLSIDNSEEVVRAVLAGAADVGFVEDEVAHPGIATEPLLEDELLVVAGAGHRFARQDEVTIDDLATERFVMRERGSGTRRVAEEHLDAAGLAPGRLRVAAELGGLEAIKAAVAADLGVTILSRAAVDRELALGTLVARPLAGRRIRRSIDLVTAVGATTLPATRELVELMRAAWGASRM